jgi:hypothetical protein
VVTFYVRLESTEAALSLMGENVRSPVGTSSSRCCQSALAVVLRFDSKIGEVGGRAAQRGQHGLMVQVLIGPLSL